MRKTRSSRSISSVIASRRASRKRSVRAMAVDCPRGLSSGCEGAAVRGGLELGDRGLGALVGEADGVGDLGLDALLELAEARLAQALRLERGARDVQRVALLVLVELGL